MLEIRKAHHADRPAIWQIIKAVIAGGDTYVFLPDATEDEMMSYWFSPDKHNYVAVLDGEVVGTFWLRANQPGLGSHVGNAAYMVTPHATAKESANKWRSGRSTGHGGSASLRCSSTLSSKATPSPSNSGKRSASK